MEDYKRLLFSMDLSLESTIMLKRAAGVAKTMGAELYVLHIVDSSPSGNMDKSIQQAKDMIIELAESLDIPESNILIKTGNVQEAILSTISEQNINLIVIGSHGKKGISPLFGAIAEKTLSEQRCDVLTLSVVNYRKG